MHSPPSPLMQVPVELSRSHVSSPVALSMLVSANTRTGVAGTQLTNPLVVRVADVYGNRVPNAAVLFAVTGGGGSVGAPNAVTDANGEARTTWTLGAVTGANAAKATVTTL